MSSEKNQETDVMNNINNINSHNKINIKNPHSQYRSLDEERLITTSVNKQVYLSNFFNKLTSAYSSCKNLLHKMEDNYQNYQKDKNESNNLDVPDDDLDHTSISGDEVINITKETKENSNNSKIEKEEATPAQNIINEEKPNLNLLNTVNINDIPNLCGNNLTLNENLMSNQSIMKHDLLVNCNGDINFNNENEKEEDNMNLSMDINRSVEVDFGNVSITLNQNNENDRNRITFGEDKFENIKNIGKDLFNVNLTNTNMKTPTKQINKKIVSNPNSNNNSSNKYNAIPSKKNISNLKNNPLNYSLIKSNSMKNSNSSISVNKKNTTNSNMNVNAVSSKNSQDKKTLSNSSSANKIIITGGMKNIYTMNNGNKTERSTSSSTMASSKNRNISDKSNNGGLLKKSSKNFTKNGIMNSSSVSVSVSGINKLSLSSENSNDLIKDLEEIFGQNLENFDEELLYNSLEEFDSKLLIRSLIFLTFEQKKTINQLKSNSNNKSMGLSKAPMSSTLKNSGIGSLTARPPLKSKQMTSQNPQQDKDDIKSVKKGFHMRSSSSSSASNTSNINKSSLPPKYTLVKK